MSMVAPTTLVKNCQRGNKQQGTIFIFKFSKSEHTYPIFTVHYASSLFLNQRERKRESEEKLFFPDYTLLISRNFYLTLRHKPFKSHPNFGDILISLLNFLNYKSIPASFASNYVFVHELPLGCKTITNHFFLNFLTELSFNF